MKVKTVCLQTAAVVAVLALGGSSALAQHAGDVAVGRSAAGQLKVKPFDPNGTPSFDPSRGVGLLTQIPDPPAPPESYRASNPGFDANFPGDPNNDYYALDDGASIRLVAYADMQPAFSVKYSTQTIYHAGDWITLGSSVLHRHPVFIVDCNDPAFDPVRTLWWGTFILCDVGGTAYADSEPFTLRFSIVQCTPGDMNGDGRVTFADIDPFVAALSPTATLAQRCAADANRNGYVTFADIDPFVALIGTTANP